MTWTPPDCDGSDEATQFREDASGDYGRAWTANEFAGSSGPEEVNLQRGNPKTKRRRLRAAAPPQAWQDRIVRILEDFNSCSDGHMELSSDFQKPGDPQHILLRQLALTQNAVVVELDGLFCLRRIGAKVAKVGPFGAIKNILKSHGCRMSVRQCVQLLETTYEDERLLLQMCGMRHSWHQRWNLKQMTSEFSRVGITFDQQYTWMATKGKTPGPQSDSESGEVAQLRPRHVVSVRADGNDLSSIVEVLRHAKRALDRDDARNARKLFADDDHFARGVQSDGFPWWGDAPPLETSGGEAGSKLAQITKRSLPAHELRDVVNEAIDEFKVVVVVGATGCGKSTQLPIAWYEWCKEKNPEAVCRVVCCQPRKIAAISLADRVALENAKPLGGLIGYKVRFETQASRDTDVLYCTTGVLLRAIIRNPSLDGVTCVFLDEVHERDVLADFTMMVLRDMMKNSRPDLKLVLMSATVDPEWCERYFPGCHTVEVPGESPYPVDWHWLEDCLQVTGHRPVAPREDRSRLTSEQIQAALSALPSQHMDKMQSINDVMCAPEDWIDYDLIVKLVDYVDELDDFDSVDTSEDECGMQAPIVKGAVLVFMPGIGEIRQLISKLKTSKKVSTYFILPLHSTLPPDEQKRVFARPPPGQRKIVVTTNIAESSVTVDDVVYVIDSGRERLLGFNPATNISSLMTQWVARSNAIQRKGRAGRCRAGNYFALFSSVQYKQLFVGTHPPEMQRTQVESLCLQAKALGFEDLESTLERAPAPPDKRTIDSAIITLMSMGAMNEDQSLTRLGKLLMALPVHPQLGKFLLYSRLLECTDAALTIAAALDVGRVWTAGARATNPAENRRLELSGGLRSDHWTLVQVYRQWRRCSWDVEEQRRFCEEFAVNHRTMETVHKVRDELLRHLQDLEGGSRPSARGPPSVRAEYEDPCMELAAVNSALAASMHVARIDPLFDLVCLNSPPSRAVIAQASVNARKHMVDPRLFREGLAVWFNRLQTSELFVDDCTIVPALPVLLVGPPVSPACGFPHYARLLPPLLEAADADVKRDEIQQEEVANIKDLVRQLYQEHNPAKLGEVDDLFQKYRGVERDMYVRICRKYGVEPAPSRAPQRGEEQMDRHMPWLKCSNPNILTTLLELRAAVVELFCRSVGKPLGMLPSESSTAFRSLRRLLVNLSSIEDLRLRVHHEYGPLEDCEQLTAPLEEPWVNDGKGNRGDTQKHHSS